MSYIGQTQLERESRGAEMVTGAVGSNAALDMSEDIVDDAGFEGEKDPHTLAESLLREHPDYQAEADFWNKYLDLYESNDVYRYIFRHPREVYSMWRKRVERGYYYNYVASVVDLYVSYIFCAPIDRLIDEERQKNFFTDEIYEDADRSGTLYTVFLQEACSMALAMGHVGVLVDSPKDDFGEGFITTSEMERQENKLHPFLTLVLPQQILDWELDEFGKFEWVKIVTQRPQKRSWDQPVDENAKTVMIWTKEDWQEYKIFSDEFGKESAELVGSAPHSLEEVPLVIFRFGKKAKHPWFGKSFVKDIADINIALLNWSSMGDEEIHERCLNILTMQTMGEDSKVEIGHHNVLEYEGEQPPQYLQPGENPLKLIMSWIGMAIEEIQRLAKLKGPTGMEDVREATSGIAYAFEFNETNQTLASKAEALEQAEMDIHRLLAKWMGIEFTGKINYPREFGVDDAQMDLQILNLAQQYLSSVTARKEMEKKVSRKLFAKGGTDLRQKIESEIDESPEDQSLEGIFGMVPPGGGNQVPPQDQFPPAPDEESGDTTGNSREGDFGR